METELTRLQVFSATKCVGGAVRALFALSAFVTALSSSAGQYVTETTLTYSTVFGGYYTGLSVEITTDPSIASAMFSTGTSSLGGGGSIYPVFFTFTDLLPGTTYYYRSYYYNFGSGGATVPKWSESVTTLGTPVPGLPNAITRYPTNIGMTAATLEGTINSKGSAASIQFEVSKDNELANSWLVDASAIPAGSDATIVTKELSDLEEGTQYYYRVLATNDFGLRRGAIQSFTTNSRLTLLANEVDVTENTATLRATVDAYGKVARAWFEYGRLNSNVSDLTPEVLIAPSSTPNALVFPLAGLPPNTTYSFRVIAEKSGQYFTTPNVAFTTLPGRPTISLRNARTRANSAFLQASVGSGPDPGTAWLELGTDADLATASVVGSIEVGGEPFHSLYATVTVLPGITYYFRAVARNGHGTRMSEIRSFVGRAESGPVVVTRPVTDVGAETARIRGTVSMGESVTQAWFIYGPDPQLVSGNITTSRQWVVNQDDFTADVAETIAGLTSGVRYYFRAAARDSYYPTVYGPILSFVAGRPSALYATGSGVPHAGESGSGIPAAAKWKAFGVPSIANDGRVVFRAKIETPQESLNAVYLGASDEASFAGSGQRIVALEGDACSDTDEAMFSNFKDPLLNNDGEIVFLATLTNANTATNLGIWRQDAATGARSLVARKGAQPPGVAAGARWKAFNSVALSDGAAGSDLIAFTATMVTGANGSPGPGGVTSRDDTGLWIAVGSGTTLALRAGQLVAVGSTAKTVKSFVALKPVPGAPGQGRGATVAGVLARVIFADGTQALMRCDATGAAVVAFAGDPITGMAENARTFGVPTQSRRGSAAFAVTLTGATSQNEALVIETGPGALIPLVRKGTPPFPEDNASIQAFTGVTNDSEGRVAFIARLVGGFTTKQNDSALFITDGERPKLIAREGAQPPGVDVGAKWTAFSSLALPEDGIGPLFIGKLAVPVPGGPSRPRISQSGNAGLWGVDSQGILRLIVLCGDPFDEKRKIKALSVLSVVSGSPTQTRSINDRREIVSQATLDDGSQAILKLNVP